MKRSLFLVSVVLLAAARAAAVEIKFNQFKPLDRAAPVEPKPAEGGEKAPPPPSPETVAPDDPSTNDIAHAPAPGRRTPSRAATDRDHPRSKEEIEGALKAIGKRRAEDYTGLAHKGPKATKIPEEQIRALNRLNAYRYLCGLSFDVTLDPDQTELAQAAAEICNKLGRLDHSPPNPGLMEADYQKARRGAGSSNLFAGGGPESSVNGFMNDSDPGNITRVGHRRWCLNPRMGKTGFGHDGSYTAMFSMDGSGPGRPFEFIAYPAPGYMPSAWFNPSYAWSVSLNPEQFRAPDNAKLQVAIYPLRGSHGVEPDRRGKPLKLNCQTVDTGGYGVPLCLIFRPEEVDTSPGNRYWVEINGLSGGKSRLEYLVEFVP